MNEDSEGIFIGMSEDVMDDPSRILGHLELVKGKVFRHDVRLRGRLTE